jgi:hypothetical protein
MPTFYCQVHAGVGATIPVPHASGGRNWRPVRHCIDLVSKTSLLGGKTRRRVERLLPGSYSYAAEVLIKGSIDRYPSFVCPRICQSPLKMAQCWSKASESSADGPHLKFRGI